MKEEWKDIIGYEDRYKISNQGVVYSKINGIILKPQSSSNEYLVVFLSRKAHSLSRLVAKHFIPNPEDKPQVAHLDGCKINNKHTNLVWATQSENEHHKVAHGTSNRKLTEVEVLDICACYTADVPVKTICQKYDINRSVINHILQRKMYKEIKRPFIQARRKDTLTREERQSILDLRDSGLTYTKIATILNRGRTSVARVLKNRIK